MKNQFTYFITTEQGVWSQKEMNFLHFLLFIYYANRQNINHNAPKHNINISA